MLGYSNSSNVVQRLKQLGVEYKRGKIVSLFEQEILDFLKTCTANVICGDRKILGNKELDIYLPDHKLAIECNGSYWHSEKQGKDSKYHLSKTEQCLVQGIQLIHIWEHDWIQQQELITSRIKAKLGLNATIYARCTEIRHVDSNEVKLFLIKNHIQGYCVSSENYGLYHDNILIALMTFSKPRFTKIYDWELIRYCSKQGIHVVGGAGKLFKYFAKTHNPKSVISYSDRMWNTGGMYKQLGFEHNHSSKPAYYYTVDYKLFENRVSYQKHKLKDKLETFDPNLTEWQNMQANGYDRIWDCGNDVWVRTFK